MHTLTTHFVLGYHGCSATVAERLVAGDPFRPSRNETDWLGHGAYFWESDPDRALSWATDRFGDPANPDEPAVVGAVIDLGNCLDLTTRAGVMKIELAYRSFATQVARRGGAMPVNADQNHRHLDCAVINHLHDLTDPKNQAKPSESRTRPADTVRGVFIDGGEVYPGSGFSRRTHTQLCVRNTTCIKGVFHWRPENGPPTAAVTMLRA